MKRDEMMMQVDFSSKYVDILRRSMGCWLNNVELLSIYR